MSGVGVSDANEVGRQRSRGKKALCSSVNGPQRTGTMVGVNQAV